MDHRPRPADPRLAALFDTARELIEVIVVENGHLDRRQPEMLSQTEGRKGKLVDDYRVRVTALQKARAAGQTFPERDRKLLNAIGQDLNIAMTDHARRVIRVKSITEGLVQAIADQAHREKRRVDGYGANGRQQAVSVARTAYARPTALSVNRTV